MFFQTKELTYTKIYLLHLILYSLSDLIYLSYSIDLSSLTTLFLSLTVFLNKLTLGNNVRGFAFSSPSK